MIEMLYLYEFHNVVKSFSKEETACRGIKSKEDRDGLISEVVQTF